MREVEECEDLRRILALPRREPTIDDAFVDELSAVLLRDDGPCDERIPNEQGLCPKCLEAGFHVPLRLRPLQALALHDIAEYGGAFLPLDLGEGKTLISLLAALVLDSKRPLLMLRANLIQKTAMERDALARHWRIPNHIRFMSYTMLGLKHQACELDAYEPDLIVCDEVQGLKNAGASVTRRVERRMEAFPDTAFVGMTGTIMAKSILDFAHIIIWALKLGAPVPLNPAKLLEWALCLDAKVENEFQRLEPGALLQLADPSDIEEAGGCELRAARLAFKRRLHETPGVIASAPTGTKVERINAAGAKEPVPLIIRPLRYDLSATTHVHFKALRDDKVTPDGDQIWEAAQVWQHARELALGFHQVWDPQPPEEWKTARRQWHSLVREIISHSTTLDSPDQVAEACDLGRLPSGTKIPADRLEHWRSVLKEWRDANSAPFYPNGDPFRPNPVPRWHDDSALLVAADWMREPGIVWVEHVPFGERLAELTGCKYYGAKGLAPDGEFVDHADGKRSIIVSVDANKEGRNLQRNWHRNLIITLAEGAALNHQLLGRTHRPGQLRDVIVDVFIGCAEHVRAWQKSIAQAHVTRDTAGTQNKMLIADVSAWPSDLEMATWVGARWNK